MSGNGADIGQVIAMLGEVLYVQRGYSHELNELKSRLDGVQGSLTGLRQSVGHYHVSVLGHGILISELDARVRRLEEHLKLPPMAA